MPAGPVIRNAILDHALGGPNYVRPSTVYVSLYTMSPASPGGGTEVSGNGYTRVAVPNNSSSWTTAANGVKTNKIPITFPTPTGSWGTIKAGGIHDDPTADSLMYYGIFSPPQAVTGVATVDFPVGSFTVSQL